MAPMREATQKPSTRRDPRRPSGPGAVAHWLPVLLVLVMLGAGLAAYRFEVGQKYLPWLAADPETEPAAVAPPAGLDLPDWSAPEPALDDVEGGGLDPVRVARALRRPLADPDLGPRVSVAVGELAGAEPVWSTGASTFIPASTTKVVTAAAALEALGPAATFTTRVVTGASQREVVLVGGGDPYLASQPASPEEATTLYPERADLMTLAADTAAALGGRGRIRVRFDDSLFSGPSDNPEWRPDYVPDDIVSPITALMADGGREPDGWRRYDDPSLAAAQAFARGLEAAGLEVKGRVRPGAAREAAAELAAVESAPLAQIAERVLDVSDNEGAEVLARHVGLAVSGEGSFVAGAAGILQTLRSLGVDTSGAVVHDGSGLSRNNRLTAQLLLDVLRVAAGSQERLRSTLTGLPVAGFSGSLTWRFDDGPPRARGTVRAKTGTLSGVHALAGLVTGRQGVPMVFVVAADRTDDARKVDAQDAVDQVAAALAACRCAAGSGG